MSLIFFAVLIGAAPGSALGYFAGAPPAPARSLRRGGAVPSDSAVSMQNGAR
jgi:hypothetical protein